MPADELNREIAAGVEFRGYEADGGDLALPHRAEVELQVNLSAMSWRINFNHLWPGNSICS
jgi:hypothetical protein